MRALLVAVFLVGCGRLGFDSHELDGGGDALEDAEGDGDLDAGGDADIDAEMDSDVDSEIEAGLDSSADGDADDSPEDAANDADTANDADAPDADSPSRWVRVQHLSASFSDLELEVRVPIDPVTYARSVVIWTGQDTVNISPLTARVLLAPEGDAAVAQRAQSGEASRVFFQVVEFSPAAIDQLHPMAASRAYNAGAPSFDLALTTDVDSSFSAAFWAGSTSTKVSGGPRDWTWAASSNFLVEDGDVNWSFGIGCCNDTETITTALSVVQFAPELVESVTPFSETIASALQRTASIAVPFPERSMIVTGGPTSNVVLLGTFANYVSSLTIEDEAMIQRMGVATGGPVTQRGQLVTFQPGVIRDIQRGTIGIASGALGAGFTLAPVRPSATIVLQTGMATPGETCWPALRLVGDDEINASRSLESYCTIDPADVTYEVVEFN